MKSLDFHASSLHLRYIYDVRDTIMIAVIMCGGKGSRMTKSIEKSLLKLRDQTLIKYVLDALIGSKNFESIIAVPSVNTPSTSTFLYNHQYYTSGVIDIVEGKGISYSADLSIILKKLKPARVFVVAADLPLLNPRIIQKIIIQCLPCFPCTCVILEKSFVKNFGVIPSVVFNIGTKEYCYSGILIIDSSKLKSNSKLEEYYLIMNEKEIAVNVNTVVELEIAERLLCS